MAYEQRSVALAAATWLACLAVGCGRPTTGSAPTANTTAETPVVAASIPEPAASAPDAAVTSSLASAQPVDSPPSSLDSCGLTATLRRGADGAFTLMLKNEGSSTLRLVLPGDGSEAGWRTPTLGWAATSGGKPVPLEGAARCGLTNRIEAKEIFSLAPNAERRITEWLPPPSLPRGAYDVRLTYRNDPRLAGGKVAVTEDVKRGLEQTSACEVTTAPLHVTIR